MRNQIESEQALARSIQERDEAIASAKRDRMVRDAKEKAWEAGVMLFVI